ncbi:hypothetical protein LZL87_011616 [Fusarium oxysporum]|nr:hypothetical protein LZL87_011616 [Fusarium oxysporum]
MSSPTFYPLPRLPTEIQLQIWKAACIVSAIPGYESYEQTGLHYVNVDTVKTGGRDRLTLRALDNNQGPNGDEEVPNNNRSAYMWDGGLWGACKLSREVITEEICSMCLRLPDYHQGYLGRPAILTSRNTHEGWIVDLPETLEELKAENSARGLVATWIEGVASGWVRAPQLYLIDKGTLLVQNARGYGPITTATASTMIRALDELLPFKEYGHLYEKNNPDSWDEELHMWFDFNIFQEIEVLVRFEYADYKEVSWTAVCNDLSDKHEKGSEKAISAYGRVYDLEYVSRVEYIRLLDLDLERVETEVGHE